MSWYANYNEASKQLDTLIDQKPSFKDLLSYPQFIPQLKSFNPKLLDYITNSIEIPKEIVHYISQPPSQQDTNDRKYRLPLLTVQVIETETTCIRNSLLKLTPPPNHQNYFQTMFDMFKAPTILPLLAGYFSRVNLVLYRTCYREAIESVYASPEYFEHLINHSSHQSIAQCICLYLNIESSKNIPPTESKILLKKKTVENILQKISQEYRQQKQDSFVTIQNLCMVLQELIEKYYLIADGKILLETILEAKNCELIISMMGAEKEYSYPAMMVALMILKYYTFSSFNSDEGSGQLARRNMERLEAQPFVVIICENYNRLFNKVKQSQKITLYQYKLVEVLCHCMTLSSIKMMTVIKESELFPTMINIMFRDGACNIFHNLLERAIRHIIVTDKKIFDQYRRYLFCEISIIDLTVKRLTDMFPTPEALQQARKQPYFGILMTIVKVYSGITTSDSLIEETITSKSKIWNKASKTFIKPFEALLVPNLGEYPNTPEPAPLTYTRIDNKKNSDHQFSQIIVENVLAMEEVKRQQQSLNKKLQLGNEIKKQDNLSEHTTKIQDDIFFSVPIEESLSRKKSQNQDRIQESSQKKDNIIEKNDEENKNIQQKTNKQESKKQQPSGQGQRQENDDKKESVGFNSYLNKRMAEVGEEIKLKRSGSEEKRLGSAGKRARLTSPSPSRKKNSWKSDDQPQEPKKTNRIALSKDLPKIPLGNNRSNNLSKSTVAESKKFEEQDNDRRMSQSMANMDILKHTVCKRVKIPPKSEKTFRRFEQKDKAFFQYIGITF